MACDVDTGAVFKHPVHCFGCDQAFYFTLRKIAEAKKLACPLCGSDINLADEAYGFVVTSVKETIALIDQSPPSLQRTSIACPELSTGLKIGLRLCLINARIAAPLVLALSVQKLCCITGPSYGCPKNALYEVIEEGIL
jgi:hypothetical protein